MAFTNPGMVNSFAAMSTRKPSSRKVAEVIGPMEAHRIASRLATGTPFLASFARNGDLAPNKATKFRTVEELVNVTTCGRRCGFRNTLRSRVREDCGTTVS